jgi:D-alanine-D-alanine ligase
MAGFAVAEQFLLSKNAYAEDPKLAVSQIIQKFGYPLIAKPVDDGCSSAVKLIRNEQQLADYLRIMFRENEELNPEQIQALGLRPKEEFPRKNQVLIEEFIQKKDAIHFLEVTGGLLTHKLPNGELQYELFEPSETLASGAILSLEEKFLAGEGQNLTPARFVPAQTQLSHAQISAQVRQDLEKAARLLGVEGYARIDAFVRVYADGRAETLVIEVNSLPGMTPATCIFHQCALNGYKPFEFIDKILEFGRARQAS